MPDGLKTTTDGAAAIPAVLVLSAAQAGTPHQEALVGGI